jgi:peptidoglycan/LPS O-acetylase OafA/YrhL
MIPAPRATRARVPRTAYALALLAALLAPLAGALLASSPMGEIQPLIPGFILCALLAGAFACCWPPPGWRWGLWVGSGFALFLGFVSLAYLNQGQLRWVPAGEGAGIVLLACLGGAAGSWLGRRLRRSRC